MPLFGISRKRYINQTQRFPLIANVCVTPQVGLDI